MDITQRQITKIAREVGKFTARTMKAEGVGTAEFDLIHVVRKNPGITQAEICKSLGADKGAVAKQTANLEAKGYLRRESNPTDGRSQLIYPTERAQSLKNSKAHIETLFYEWLAEALTDYTIFYNGPKCGASAPDHAHFQAGNKGFMPIEKDWRGQTAGKIADYRKAALWYLDDAPRATLVIESTSKEDAADLFDIIYRSLDVKPEEDEPMMNVLVLYEADRWVVFVFPREKHRPACYTAEGEANLLSSPASVDLGGVFITPVEKDFLKITAEDVAQILSEVCLSATDFHKVRQRIREKI